MSSKTFDLDKIEGFEWDKGNLTKNKERHNVETKESEEVFFNRPIILLSDPKHSTDKERRLCVLGKTDKGRLLAIYFTIRKNKIRVISSRNMSKKDRAIFIAEEVKKEEKR